MWYENHINDENRRTSQYTTLAKSFNKNIFTDISAQRLL